MATVTVYTAEKMKEIEDNSIKSASFSSGNLVLITNDDSTIITPITLESLADDPAFSGRYAPRAADAALWTAGGSLQTPSHASLDITGDIEVVARCSKDDWHPPPGHQQILASRRGSAAESNSWQLVFSWASTPLTLRWGWRKDGVNLFSGQQCLAPADDGWLVDGAAYWFRFTRVAATGILTCGHHPDQDDEPDPGDYIPWTITTGDPVAGAITPTDVPLEFGSYSNGVLSLVGHRRELIVRDGIGGTVVAHFSDQSGRIPLRDSTGKVWTMVNSVNWGWD